MDKLDERIAIANLNQADLPDLVRCPKCQHVYELVDSIQALRCLNCKHSSCRNCQRPWDDKHIGKNCEELDDAETDGETKLRRLFEERMTAELVRPCPKCKTPLMKNEGCNKMTCSCKATLCYVCRTPFIGYDHFCQHPRNPGFPCDQCTKCSLWIDPAAEDEERIRRINASLFQIFMGTKLVPGWGIFFFILSFNQFVFFSDGCSS